MERAAEKSGGSILFCRWTIPYSRKHGRFFPRPKTRPVQYARRFAAFISKKTWRIPFAKFFERNLNICQHNQRQRQLEHRMFPMTPMFLIFFKHCKMNSQQENPGVYVHTHPDFSLGKTVCTLIHTTTTLNCLSIQSLYHLENPSAARAETIAARGGDGASIAF